MPHAIYIPFVFAFGACIGSFLNVVVWRLPRGESLVNPPSHCPKCDRKLIWRDNIPILGWLKLGGRCRFCKATISVRYPIIEAVTALLFVAYYCFFFICHYGPLSPNQVAMMMSRSTFGIVIVPTPVLLDWPMLALYLALLSALLAASLIDAELFIIPPGIPWLMAAAGVIVHSVFDHPDLAGALSLTLHGRPPGPDAALAAGGAIGLAISMSLWWLQILPLSFPEGAPILESDRKLLAREIRAARREGREVPPVPPRYTRGQVRLEMSKEILFLLPPIAGGVIWLMLTSRNQALAHWWRVVLSHDWINGLLGALLGGMVGGLVVWATRILGTFAFGRIAMGLGDADLMFGVGAVLGAGPATIAFFLAPFFGLLIAMYMLFARKNRELPYGPYLSFASAFIMLFYFKIYAYIAPGLSAMVMEISACLSGAAVLVGGAVALGWCGKAWLLAGRR